VCLVLSRKARRCRETMVAELVDSPPSIAA
jgi:hypothetical protein